MDATKWADSELDVVRARRLGVGFALAAAVLAGTVAVVASASPPPSETDEEPLDVVFGEVVAEEEDVEPEAEEMEPEPEPPPPMEEPPKTQMPVRAGPRPVPIDAAPTAVPTTEAAETTPNPGDFGAGSDPNQSPGGGGDAIDGRGGPPPAVVPKPAPPPKPKPRPKPKKKKKKKPRRITEGMTPPKRLSGGAPGYPASAKSQGIEGTVVVVYVVSASGSVTSAKAVRGPAALRPACVAAVRAWRFEPAKDENGNAMSARRIAKFPFRIRTK